MDVLSFGGEISIEAQAAQATLERIDKLIETVENGFSKLAEQASADMSRMEGETGKLADALQNKWEHLGDRMLAVGETMVANVTEPILKTLESILEVGSAFDDAF